MAQARLLRPRQIAQLLEVSEGTVRRWVSEGRLPAMRTLGGQIRIDPEEAAKALGMSVPPMQEEQAA